mgnify:CR=1 FL=1
MKPRPAPRCVHLVAAVVAVFAIVASLPARADESTWDLSELYPDAASWEKARDQLPSRFAELDRYKDRPVIAYCRSGGRSGVPYSRAVV